MGWRTGTMAMLLGGWSMVATLQAQPWKPVEGHLMTRWAADVDPQRVHPEYPRPQLVREAWVNLNGLWDYAITPADAERPQRFDGQILVPFPIESALSGVKKPVMPDQRLWYRRGFTAPPRPDGGRLLLHFGGVDWHASVFVNGQSVGEHRGGHTPFSFDITDALRDGGEQELLVGVLDPTDVGSQPRGKQVLEPGGIWYTAVTGIWQTVWLEPVPAASLASLKLTPDLDRSALRLEPTIRGNAEGATLEVVASDGGVEVARAQGPADRPLELLVPDARPWSPSSPHLYDLAVTLRRGDATLDRVGSYFGLRKVEIRATEDGFDRIFLNNEPLFLFGPLDQGWWPDGLYTAPTDAALRYDIEITRRMGFNFARKHIKVEPARWYYWADRLGLMVWQDMPSGMARGRRQGINPGEPDAVFEPAEAEQFRRELAAMVETLHPFPSIVAWIPFNEGWGQHDTNPVLEWTKQLDPTRLVNGPSGWEDRGFGDMIDAHIYPGPGMFPPVKGRASVLGEFGGLGLPVEGHLWTRERNWGYRTYRTQQELQLHYEQLIRRLRPLIGRGLAAAVYTQTTDVEIEVNGLLTYDRAVLKLDEDYLAALHAPLYQPWHAMKEIELVPTSQETPQRWRHTASDPGARWFERDFDDAAWTESPGGFGEPTTPGAVVGTLWKSSDLWLRRSFELSEVPQDPHLLIHHDEDVEVYLNGVRVASLRGYLTGYEAVPLSAEHRALLVPGRNVLAVHVRQTRGGQFIDVGLVDYHPTR